MEPTAFKIDEQTHEIRACPACQVPSWVRLCNSQTVAHFEPGICEQGAWINSVIDLIDDTIEMSGM